MPLLPPLLSFHSSSSSKFAKRLCVMRSSTSPSLESTPPATCHPAGSRGVVQPRQALAVFSSSSDCHPLEGEPAELGMLGCSAAEVPPAPASGLFKTNAK